MIDSNHLNSIAIEFSIHFLIYNVHLINWVISEVDDSETKRSEERKKSRRRRKYIFFPETEKLMRCYDSEATLET